MNVRFRPLVLAVTLATCGCARGCEPEPPPPQPRPAPAPQVQQHPAEPVERALGLHLPERRTGTELPAMTTLPHRKLLVFQPDRHLIVAVTAQRVRLFERELTGADLADEAKLTELLRWGLQQWQQRSGLGANRLVLAIGQGTPPELVGRVRRLAMTANTWRVAAVARDGDGLVELMLDPVPAQRPHQAR